MVVLAQHKISVEIFSWRSQYKKHRQKTGTRSQRVRLMETKARLTTTLAQQMKTWTQLGRKHQSDSGFKPPLLRPRISFKLFYFKNFNSSSSRSRVTRHTEILLCKIITTMPIFPAQLSITDLTTVISSHTTMSQGQFNYILESF